MQNGKKKEKRILQHISADYTRENKPWLIFSRVKGYNKKHQSRCCFIFLLYALISYIKYMKKQIRKYSILVHFL